MPDSATPWTASHQAPLSKRFSRQGYWSGLPFPSAGKPTTPDPSGPPKTKFGQIQALKKRSLNVQEKQTTRTKRGQETINRFRYPKTSFRCGIQDKEYILMYEMSAGNGMKNCEQQEATCNDQGLREWAEGPQT